MNNSNPPKQLLSPIIKREKYGPCNICKSIEKLTWDHVPPQGSTKTRPMQQTTVLQNIASINLENHYYTISQNGIKFRTICSKCNNELLGLKYDPILNKFSRELSLYITSSLLLPDIIHIKTTPNLLIRAIFGHLLSAKGIFENTVPDEKMRAFFINKTLLIPEGLKVFYWVHPYNNVIIIRDVVMPAIRRNFSIKPGVFSILKFFPIGFIVSDVDKYENLDELTSYYKQEEINLPIRLTKIRHSQWPEIVDKGNLISGGQSIQSSILATQKV